MYAIGSAHRSAPACACTWRRVRTPFAGRFLFFGPRVVLVVALRDAKPLLLGSDFGLAFASILI